MPAPDEPLTPDGWHQRFTRQAVWTRDLRRYLLQRVSLPANPRCLEVGSGTGALLNDLPLPPGALRVGVDLNRPFLRLAGQHNASIANVQADGYELPFACAAFDLVCCHYLLLWLDDPQAALREMRRVARPGGWVMAFAEPDYGGRVDYPPPLDELGRLQTLALRAQGADPLTGRRLVSLFQQAGFTTIHSGILGGEWLHPSANPADPTEEQVLRQDLAPLLPARRMGELLTAARLAEQNHRRVLYLPTFYALAQPT